MRFATIVVALLLALGCATQSAPVPVSGESMEALVGRWTGSYESPEAGRSGSIVFTLEAGTDTARGDVYMTPRGARVPLAPASMRRDADVQGEVLTIRFVRASGNRVHGTLDAYRDPACGCVVNTQFEGQLRADEIRGTFRTQYPAHGRVITGTWSVIRR